MESDHRRVGRTSKGWKAIALLAALCVFSAGAQEPGAPPMEAYRTNTQFGMLMCKVAVVGALAAARAQEAGVQPSGDPPAPNWRACIQKQTAEALGYLKAASAKTKKAAVREALKSHYAAWSAAMRGLEPALSERKIDYDRRQAAATDRLNEAWAKVEVEL